MICKNCGAKIDDNTVICEFCKSVVYNTSNMEPVNTLNSFIDKMKNEDRMLEEILLETKLEATRQENEFDRSYDNNVDINNDEWLNEEAIREIQNISKDQEEKNEDGVLPDGRPEWFDEIKEAEKKAEKAEKQAMYKRRFRFFEHPILVTSIVAAIMAIFSANFLLKTFTI